jgi:proline racemase
MDPESYPAMSGTNTICTSTVLFETGMVPMAEPETRFALEAPGGLVDIVADCQGGKCRSITFDNVPAFTFHLGSMIEVEGVGTLKVDVAGTEGR